MAAAGTVWFLTEINNKIFVDFHTAIFDITVDHQHHPALGANFRIELIVPSREERGSDIKPFAIKRKLIHLRSACYFDTVDFGCFTQKPPHPDLPREYRIVRIRDVILAHIAVQPIIEVKVFVVH